MKVAIIVPSEYLGDVMGDVNSRRGMILGQEQRTGAVQVDANIPLSEHVRLRYRPSFQDSGSWSVRNGT